VEVCSRFTFPLLHLFVIVCYLVWNAPLTVDCGPLPFIVPRCRCLIDCYVWITVPLLWLFPVPLIPLVGICSDPLVAVWPSSNCPFRRSRCYCCYGAITLITTVIGCWRCWITLRCTDTIPVVTDCLTLLPRSFTDWALFVCYPVLDTRCSLELNVRPTRLIYNYCIYYPHLDIVPLLFVEVHLFPRLADLFWAQHWCRCSTLIVGHLTNSIVSILMGVHWWPDWRWRPPTIPICYSWMEGCWCRYPDLLPLDWLFICYPLPPPAQACICDPFVVRRYWLTLTSQLSRWPINYWPHWTTRFVVVELVDGRCYSDPFRPLQVLGWPPIGRTLLIPFIFPFEPQTDVNWCCLLVRCRRTFQPEGHYKFARCCSQFPLHWALGIELKITFRFDLPFTR